MTDIQPSLDDQGNTKLFDPLYCAALHNAIVQHIIALDPGCASRVVRNVFEVPHPNVYIDWALRDEGVSTQQGQRPEPSSDAQLKERLGEAVATFLENIDVINSQGYYHLENRFLDLFNAPTLNRLFDFATKVKEDEWSHLRNIIQLYPCADVSSGSHEGIVFDMFTETAMCMTPDEIGYCADQSNWVPLDMVLRAWLRRFERGYFYFDGQLKERHYVRADLEEDIRAWEEYLELLESKVRELSDMATDLEEVDFTGGNLALVHPNLVQLAHSKLDPVSMALLSRLRRPKYGIKHIGPGLACYDDDLFSKIFGVTLDATVSAYGSGKTMSISSREMSPFVDSEWQPETVSTLVFPAIGPKSSPVATGIGPNTRHRRPGMYMSATNMAPYVEILDHQGKTDVFLRRSPAVPWGTMYWGNPLSYMLEAFKTTLLNSHWTVDEEGVTGNFTWFAENRDIQWRVNRILGYIDDADGDELEISNEWINFLLPGAELIEEDM